MPRLLPTLIRQAYSHSPLLPRLLRECRDLPSARNELRWLKEHTYNNTEQSNQTPSQQFRRLLSLIKRRSRGEPLQYILGTQPFGGLEILCRKQVLIPRPETEVYTTNIAQLILQLHRTGILRSKPVRIADLCSGSGCISLLLHSLLVPPQYDEQEFHNQEIGPGHGVRPHELQVHGFDISPHALKLSNENQSHGIATETLHTTAATAVAFKRLDVLALTQDAPLKTGNSEVLNSGSDFFAQHWDIVVSNPPYISPLDFAPGGTTTTSVRQYEPKLALVPPALPFSPLSSATDVSTSASSTNISDQLTRSSMDAQQADQFYHAILHASSRVSAKLIIMEIGDANQARRVRAIASKIFQQETVSLETWRDDGTEDRYGHDDSNADRKPDNGQAHERAVVVWRAEYAQWRKSTRQVSST